MITIPAVIIPMAVNFIKAVLLCSGSFTMFGRNRLNTSEKIKTNTGRMFKIAFTSDTGPNPIALNAIIADVIPTNWSMVTKPIFCVRCGRFLSYSKFVLRSA